MQLRHERKRKKNTHTFERGWSNNLKFKLETQQHINQTLKLKSIRKLQKTLTITNTQEDLLLHWLPCRAMKHPKRVRAVWGPIRDMLC